MTYTVIYVNHALGFVSFFENVHSVVCDLQLSILISRLVKPVKPVHVIVLNLTSSIFLHFWVFLLKSKSDEMTKVNSFCKKYFSKIWLDVDHTRSKVSSTETYQREWNNFDKMLFTKWGLNYLNITFSSKCYTRTGCFH